MGIKFYKEENYTSEIMPLKVFLKLVKSKKLSDKQGYARLGTSVTIYPIAVKPSEVHWRRFDKDITHVEWFWVPEKKG